MLCKECKSPLHVISGGNKIVDGKIVTVHVFGCLNSNCSLNTQEQNRTQTEQEQFNE